MQTKMKKKNPGVAIFISDKTDFKTKAIVGDKGHYIAIKGAIQQEDITLVNTYAPNTGKSKYVTSVMIDRKGEINSDTVITGDLMPH